MGRMERVGYLDPMSTALSEAVLRSLEQAF